MRYLLMIITATMLVAAPQDKKNAPKMVKDPVCGMEVDPKTAAKTVYKGKTYYFCDKDEIPDFEKAPEKYLKPGPPAKKK